jgi:hypothetical protein
MDSGAELRFALTVQPGRAQRPWQALLHPVHPVQPGLPEPEGTPLAFESPLALARHLAALGLPAERRRGLR